jgi:hypothetical protein
MPEGRGTQPESLVDKLANEGYYQAETGEESMPCLARLVMEAQALLEE